MAEVPLRAGAPADAEAVRALGSAVVPSTYNAIDPAYAGHVMDRWWSFSHLEDSLGRIRWWIAGTDGAATGVACLGSMDDRQVLWMLYVHPDHQGTGLGRRLLKQAIEAADPDPLWLEHVAGNDAAAAFYRAHGFSEVRRDPQPPYPDQIWMRRDPTS